MIHVGDIMIHVGDIMSSIGDVPYSERNHQTFRTGGMFDIFQDLNSLFCRYFAYLKEV